MPKRWPGRTSRKRSPNGKEKGQEISVEFAPPKSTPSYRKLERQTGRSDDSLKKWHNIYLGCTDYEQYKAIAEDKATARANGEREGGVSPPS